MKDIDAFASFAKCDALLQTEGKYIVVYISLIMPSREGREYVYSYNICNYRYILIV